MRTGLHRWSGTIGMVFFVMSTLIGGAGDAQAGPVRQTDLEGTAKAMFLPASFSDLQAALPLKNFIALAASRIVTPCLHRHGYDFDFPYVAETYNWSDANSLFPDLRRIARYGLSTPADLDGERDWTPPIPRDERPAFYVILAACSRPVVSAEREGMSRWLALEGRWFDIDAKDGGRQTYVRLVERFAVCTHRLGYVGTTPTIFLQGVDLLLQRSIAAGEPRSDQEAISLRAGRVYGQCYRSANAYRQAIRQRALARFLDRERSAIALAQKQLARTVASLSAQSGVPFGMS
jgi:hypothetical protein